MVIGKGRLEWCADEKYGVVLRFMRRRWLSRGGALCERLTSRRDAIPLMTYGPMMYVPVRADR